MKQTNEKKMSNETMWSDPIKLKKIREIFAPNVSDLEFESFTGLGKSTNLNPFKKEIWCIKYGNSPAQTFIARDGYRIVALKHAEYDYHQCDTVYENDDFRVKDGCIDHSYTLAERGKLIGAYCIVKRKSASRNVYTFVKFSEYNTGKSLWGTKPDVMIRKVAEAMGLRAAFQDVLGGTYCPEEMDTFEVELESISEESIAVLNNLIEQKQLSFDRLEKAKAFYKVSNFSELSLDKYSDFIQKIRKISDPKPLVEDVHNDL